MARNEEKQLARLNRFYLQKEKDEQIQKRPPRPRLETLSTGPDVKKWIPSILGDIDFYVKQMEVSCYPQRTIDDFNERINRLRGEYKAFVRKIRQLEPDLDATPWTDRPYRKRNKTDLVTGVTDSTEADTEKDSGEKKTDTLEIAVLSTPVLEKDEFYASCYGYSEPIQVADSNDHCSLHDQPLKFNFSGQGQIRNDCVKRTLPKWLRSKESHHKESLDNSNCIENEIFDIKSKLTNQNLKSYRQINEISQEQRSDSHAVVQRSDSHTVVQRSDSHAVVSLSENTKLWDKNSCSSAPLASDICGVDVREDSQNTHRDSDSHINDSCHREVMAGQSERIDRQTIGESRDTDRQTEGQNAPHVGLVPYTESCSSSDDES